MGNPSEYQKQLAFKLVALVVTLLISTSCGTVGRNQVKQGYGGSAVLSIHVPNAKVYPATVYDIYSIKGGLVPAIIELPISIAIDTILLPYDIATYDQYL